MAVNNKNSSKTWLYVLVGIGTITVLCISAVVISAARQLSIFIKPDERGLVLLLNEQTGEILESGYHFVFPNKQVIIFRISHQTYTMSANSTGGADFIDGLTKDGQKIQIDVSVIYAVDPERLPDLYKTWRNTYQESVVRPMSRSITRNTLGEFTYNEVSEKRDEIEKIISAELEHSLSENFLVLVKFELLDVRIAP
jgi:regulator of protease activity HflC (stomatin/prohibitin superfamily)